MLTRWYILQFGLGKSPPIVTDRWVPKIIFEVLQGEHTFFLWLHQKLNWFSILHDVFLPRVFMDTKTNSMFQSYHLDPFQNTGAICRGSQCIYLDAAHHARLASISYDAARAVAGPARVDSHVRTPKGVVQLPHELCWRFQVWCGPILKWRCCRESTSMIVKSWLFFGCCCWSLFDIDPRWAVNAAMTS